MFLGNWLANLWTGLTGSRSSLDVAKRRKVRRKIGLSTSQASEQLETRVLPAAVITVVNVDSLPAATDADGDGVADPGDQIHYTVTVSNTGDATATNLTFQEIINDPNLTLVPGSINVSPLAINDTFSAVANTQLVVGGATPAAGPHSTVAGSVLANDTEFLGDSYSISMFDATSAQGGTVSLVTSGPNAGSFTYVPQAGDTGTDTFTYTLRDDGIDGIAGNADDLTSVGTVTITIGTNQVWYVDDSAGTGGTGTSTSPFDSLADVTGAAGPDGANDIIYLSSGNYSGGITLTANQTLWGENEALVVDGFTLQAAGTDPIITNAAGNGVTLATGNTLRGFTVGDTTTGDIVGTAVGSLAISNVNAIGTGPIITISTSGALTATLDTATTTSSSTTGISLTGVTGSFTASAGAISGVTGTEVFISGGTATASIASSITSNTGGSVEITGHGTNNVTMSGALNITGGTGLSVHDNTSGTIAFTNASKVVTTGSGTAVNLATNAGATINFTGGGLDIDTTSGVGLNATGGGTVTVQGTGNSIASTTGTALNVVGTNIGASDLTFQSISANGGSNGIVLNNTGSSGGLHITGTGTTNGSGGTIQNISVRGIVLINTADVSISNVALTNASTTDGTSLDLDISNSNAAIYMSNVSTAAFENVDISGTTADNGITGLNVSNFTLNNSTLTLAGNAANESGIEFSNLSGTSSISNTDISFSETNSLDIVNTDVSLNLTLNNVTFRDSQTVSSGGAVSSTGEGGFQFRSFSNAAGTPTSNIVIKDSDFLRLRTQGIQVIGEDDSIINVDITGNTIDSEADIGTGVDINGNDTSEVNFNVIGNTIHSRNGSAVNITSFANAEVMGRVNDNSDITASGIGEGIRVLAQEFSHTIIEIKSNTVTIAPGSNSGAISGQARIDSARLDITIDNNTTTVNATALNDIDLISGSSAPGESNQVFANIINNDVSNGATNILRLRVTDLSNVNRLFLQGFVDGGVGVDDDAVATWNANGNTPTATASNINVSLTGTSVAPSAGTALVPTNPLPAPLFFAPASVDAVVEPILSEPVVPETASRAIAGAVVVPPADESSVIVDDGVLSRAELDSLVAAAISRWEATGLTAAQVSLLHSVSFTIEDLPGWYLGSASAGIVTLDLNAAGNAWFIDSTPLNDSEFTGTGTKLQATATGGAAGRVDALSTIMHELGHQLGLDDSYVSADSANLMYGWIQQSERRLPAAGQAAGAEPHDHEHDGTDFLFGSMNLGNLPAGKSLTIVYDATVNSMSNRVAPTVTSQVRVLADGGINVLSDDPSLVGAANPTATAIDSVVLGDLVFSDANANGLFDGGDTGINGVTVNLYVDVNTNGVLDVGDGAVIATTTTAGGGLYAFNVVPGEYLVEIAATNFQAGGALLGRISTGGATVDPDNNTNNDDNGVNNSTPATNGIASQAITLNYNTEPTADGSGQFDINNTLDFGFVTPPDVSVTKTDGVTTAVPGGSVTYTITVSNAGPTTATGVSLIDNFPGAITSVSWTSLAVGGATGNTVGPTSGNIAETLTLPAGASVTYTVTAQISSSALTGTLVNTATVSHPDDQTPGNNSATDTDTLTPQTDISVTKTDGVTTAVPGLTTLTYTIVVTNSGPSRAVGASLVDNFPADLTGISWTSVAGVGASGNTAGPTSGNINETLTLDPGAAVTYTVTASVAAGATGNLINTASVSHANDTNGANNSATDTDTLTPQTDVSVTKTDGVTNATPGGTVTYTIVVSNSGPSTAYSTTLSDDFPVAITSVSWTSVAAGGATGNTVGPVATDINETLTLPAGATVTYTVTANISAVASGNLVNTATVFQANDTNNANDSATDTDTLGNPVSIARISDGSEAPTDGKFRVSQLIATGVDTVVTYSITGTALNGTDYTTLTGEVTITAGNTFADIDVLVLGDLTVEGTETVIVELTGFSSGDPDLILDPNPSNRTATLDIGDNDTATYTISDAFVLEGGDLSFTISLSNPVSVDTTVNVTFTDGTTSAGDFNHTTVPVTFLAGSTTAQVITVATVGDNVVEDHETLTANLVLAAPLPSGAASNVTDTGAATIANDDVATYTISDATVTEGGDLSFTLSLSNPVDVDTTVNVTFSDGTTSAGDFNHTTVPVTFLAGTNSAQAILIATVVDNVVEANETLTASLALSTPLTGGRVSSTLDTGAGTINNDDTATYTISDATVTEGGDLSFTVSLSNPVDVDTTVNVTFSDGTTSAGDFNHATAPVTFLAGTNSAQAILIATTVDSIVEANETLTASLALTIPLTGGRLSDTSDTGAGTINNDDTATYTISDATVTEGGDLSFTVSLSNPLDVDTTVNVTFSDGTTAAGDFNHTTIPVTFLAGTNSAQAILVATVVDNLVEADETLTASLALSTPLTGGRLSDTTDTATGTITNDDTATYTISDATVTEGGDLSFTVSLSNPVDVDTTVNVTFSDVSTSAGDFNHATVPVTFLAGTNSAQAILVATVVDSIVEDDETLSASLALSTPLTGGRLSNTTDAGAGTITNDDTATYTISDATVTEGGDLSFTVSLSNPVDVDTTVNVTFTDGTTSAGDFNHATVPVTFLAGTNSAQAILVATVVDALVEADESLTASLALSAPLIGGRLSDTADTGSGTITNDDTATYTISDASVTEGGDLSFTVSLSNPVDVDTTVNVTFSDGTTSAGDFDHTLIAVTFLAGTNSAQVILVPTVVDALVEDDETLTASLALATPLTGGRLSDTTDTGAGTIVNDDTATFSISDATITEGGDLSFTVSLSNPVDVDTTVLVTFSDGTTSAADFDHTPIPVTFLAGTNAAQVILVPTATDSTVEADETFTVSLALTAPLAGARLSDTSDTGTGTITNDDTATYSISDATVTEGGDLSITVSLSNPVDVDTTVNVTFSDGSTSADDFDHTTVPVTFLAGSTSAQIILVPTVTDSTVEADETFIANLALSTPLTDGRLSDTTDTGEGTILNDDTATYSIGDATVTEGGDLSFTVSLSNPVDVDTTVNLTFVDGATATGDFNHTTVPVTFLAGTNVAQVVLIPTVADDTVEADETFTVNLALSTPLTGGRLSDTTDTGAGTITNDDTATYTISDATVTEGGDLSFTVSLSNPVDVDTTVNVTFIDGTTSGDDFNHTTVPVTFLAGNNSAQVILIPTVADDTVEGDETLTANLALTIPLTGGRFSGTTDTATGTITNDDTSTLTISDVAVVEGNIGTTALVFTVTSPNAVQGGFTVEFTVTGVTADGTDYTVVTSSPLTFNGGVGETQTITIDVIGDTLGEGNETLTVTLGAITPVAPTLPASIVSGAIGTGTINNDDTVTYTIDDVTVSEADGTLVFTVTADNPLDIDVTVDVTFTNGTAGSADYASVTQQVTFLVGETSKQVTVSINDDNIVEATEDFTASLSSSTPTGGRTLIFTDTGTGTINDNDTATFTFNNVTASETDGSLVFDLVTDKPLDIDVTIDVTFTTGSATAGDFASVTQQITFLAGETTKQVTVSITDDNIVEATETFSAALSTSTPLGGRLLDLTDTGTGTISDNDTAVFTINNVTVGEGDGTLVFELATDKPLDVDVTIDVTFTDGSATGGGTDYASVTQQITFLAGQTSKQVSVAINDDNIVEATEDFSVALGTITPLADRSLDLSDTGTGTITDNDTATFTIGNVTVGEDAGSLVFDLFTDKPLDIDVTITVTFSDVTAIGGGTDYASTTQQITFLAGETSKQVTVAINDDAIVEATETFNVALSSTTPLGGRSIVTSDTATGTINDNDVATLSIAKITDGAESGAPVNGKFRITQSAVSSTDTVVTYSITGTAAAGSDYTTLTGTATILAGQTTVDIDVLVLNDNFVESTETVIATLTGFGDHDPEITLGAPLAATVDIASDDTPTITSAGTATFAENTSVATVVLDVNGDESLIAPGHALSYSLSGPDAVLFNINSATGEITFIASPNYEAPADQDADNVYRVTVTVTADTLPTKVTTQDLTIEVSPVNDVTPVFTDASPTFSIPENSAAGTVVGDVPATDGDLPAQTLTYSIVSGNESGAFAINPATGQITVANSAPLNFELVTSFTFTVRVTDNTPVARTADAVVVVNITNVVENPTITIPNPTGTYHIGNDPAFVSPDSTFAYGDVLVPNYSGAKLTVSITAGRSKKDKLNVITEGEGNGQIRRKGHKLFYGSTQIGTIKGGKGDKDGKADLVVTFNENATTAAIDDLVRRVSFETKKDAGVTRTVTLQVTGVAGVDSNVATRDIAVVE